MPKDHGVRVADSDPVIQSLPLLLVAGMPIPLPSTRYSLRALQLALRMPSFPTDGLPLVTDERHAEPPRQLPHIEGRIERHACVRSAGPLRRDRPAGALLEFRRRQVEAPEDHVAARRAA